MKKGISLLLSVVLLLSTITSLLLVPATASSTATDTVWVQDFSAYDSNNRLEQTASVITGDAEHGSILDFSPATNGNAFASVFPGSGTAKQDTTKLLKAGVTYDVSLEYIINQAPGTASGDYGNFYISLIAADSTTFWGTSAMTLVERVVYGAVTNSWKSKTLTLTPTVDSYLVLRIGTNNASTVTPHLDISVDNVRVSEALTGLNAPTTWVCDSPANYATATKTGAKSTDVYYEAEGTISDGRSVKLNGWNHTAKVPVEKNSTYTLSFWYYSDRDQTANNFRLTSVQVQDVSLTATGNGEATTVGAGRYMSAYKDAVWNNIDAWQAKNNATSNIPGEQSTWNHFEAEFASEQSTEIFITMTGNEFYLDDIKLTKKVPTIEPATDPNDPTVWRMDAPANYPTSTKIADGKDIADSATGKAVSDGKASVYLNGWNHTAKVPVEKNSTYTFSFWYYSDRDQTTNNFRLTSVQVQDISLTATGNGAASLVGEGRYLSAFANATWNNIDGWQARATNTLPGTKSEWKYFEAEFDSKESTEIFITMTGNEFYLDDINLSKKVFEIEPTEDPNDPTAWKMVKPDVYDKTAETAGSKDFSDSANDKTNSDGKASVYLKGWNHTAKIAVKKNTDYALSFWWYATNDAQTNKFARFVVQNGAVTTTTTDTTDKLLLSVSTGTYANGKWDTELTPLADAANQWNYAEFSFNSGENEKVWLWLNSSEIYLDDITLTRVIPTSMSITFDDDKPYALDASAQKYMELAADGGVDNSKSLHVFDRDFTAPSNATALNWSSIVSQQSDRVFCIPVKPNTTYRLKIDAKFAGNDHGANTAQQKEKNLYVADGYSGTKVLMYMDYSKVQVNTWDTYSTFFTTGAEQDKVCLFFNARYCHPEFWWDNILLEEFDVYEYDYDNPKTHEIITFDDSRPYSFLQADRMKIQQAPARDGKSTMALHVIKGEYDTGVTLNYAKTVGNPNMLAETKDTDPVFSLPVKENTLYRFSVWVYLPENERVSYGVLYADYNNPATIQRLEVLKDTPGEWVQYKTTFVTKPGQTRASMYFNMSKITPHIWFDDFELEEMLPGVINDTDMRYCEADYNIISADTLSDVLKAKSGVYKLAIDNSAFYTLGMTATGSGKTSVTLSFDPAGIAPIPRSADEAPDPVIVPEETAKRYGYQFVSGNTGYIYLVINNADGSLEIENLQIFKAKSMGTNREMGYIEDPNVATEELSVLGLKVDGVSGESASDSNSDSDSDSSGSTSPSTGEANILWIILMLLAASAFVLVACGKEKVRNEQ